MIYNKMYQRNKLNAINSLLHRADCFLEEGFHRGFYPLGRPAEKTGTESEPNKNDFVKSSLSGNILSR